MVSPLLDFFRLRQFQAAHKGVVLTVCLVRLVCAACTFALLCLTEKETV